MPKDRTRQRIAWEAARLMYSGQESEYHKAKLIAGRRVCAGQLKPSQLPSNAEIREEFQTLSERHAPGHALESLRGMREEALWVMRLLAPFQPRLTGGALTGRIRRGPRLEIQLFCERAEPVTDLLVHAKLPHRVVTRQVVQPDASKAFTQIQLRRQYPVQLKLYPACKSQTRFRSAQTGELVESANLHEVEALLRRTDPAEEVAAEPAGTLSALDRFVVMEVLLTPLEQVKENRRLHPEGDALYHSLQVFDLAVRELPYDEEFLLAALLHDVGKAIDAQAPIAATLEALDGIITPRTAWLIEHLPDAHAVLEGTAGVRLRRRLSANESYEELLLLARCDRQGRQVGLRTRQLNEALDYLRKLNQMCGD